MVEMKYVENDSIKLPNNIRQVGTPGDKLKIYIEDYVMTYLNQLANEKPFGQKAAILLGERKCKEGLDVFFISAAVQIDGTEITENSLHITSDMWTIIYDQIEKYFKAKHILGWFLTRPGQSVNINNEVEKIQSEQFGNKSRLFYSMDQPDQEEAFYFYENGHLVRQQGYYIYYERNEAMQTYMVEKRQDYNEARQEISEFQNRLSEKTMDVQGRKDNYNANKKNHTRWISQAAVILILFAVLVVIRRNIPERSIAVSKNMEPQTKYEFREENAENREEIREETTIMESISDTLESTEPESGEEVINHMYRTYIVREGDTLVAISREYYQDLAYVDEIIRLNQIEDPDYIYPGMVLNMP